MASKTFISSPPRATIVFESLSKTLTTGPTWPSIISFRLKILAIMMIMMLQVGPGDDYVLTVVGFNDTLSTLGDSMITNISSANLNGMKFSTK